MAKILPTIPGTILSFSSDFESSDGESMLYGAALLIGGVDEHGNAVDALWGTADLDGLDDSLNSFTEEFLLDQDFAGVSVPEALPTALPLDHDELWELEYGSVIRVSAEGETFYSVFAPLYFDQDTGEVAEAAWISSYGEVPDFNAVDSIELLYRGL